MLCLPNGPLVATLTSIPTGRKVIAILCALEESDLIRPLKHIKIQVSRPYTIHCIPETCMSDKDPMQPQNNNTYKLPGMPRTDFVKMKCWDNPWT